MGSPPTGQGSSRSLLGAVQLSKPIGQMTEEELDQVAAEVEKLRPKPMPRG